MKKDWNIDKQKIVLSNFKLPNTWPFRSEQTCSGLISMCWLFGPSDFWSLLSLKADIQILSNDSTGYMIWEVHPALCFLSFLSFFQKKLYNLWKKIETLISKKLF